MKVVCIKTTSEGFDLKEVTTVFSQEFDYSFGGKGYGLEIDKEYIVMGIQTYEDSNCVYYLIDVGGLTFWFPYLLFKVIDATIPSNWFLKVDGKKNKYGIYSIIGFKELCDDEFQVQLIDRNQEAMLTYFKRKIELEKEYQEEDCNGVEK